MSPIFPVVVVYEAGITYCDNLQELQRSPIHILGALTLDSEDILDVSGQAWKAKLRKSPKIGFKKYLKYLRGHDEFCDVEYEFRENKKIELDEFKSIVVRYSENDPGDVMQQFITHDEIIMGISKVNNYEELFSFINEKVCGASVA